MKKSIYYGFILVLIFSSAIHAQGLPCNNFEGIIEPSETVDVSSQVSGVISKIYVDRGDMVQKGDLIATLLSDVEEATVLLARARLEFEKRKDKRNLELFQKKLISIHEKDELETQILLAELHLNEVLKQLELRTLKTPVKGVVVKRHLSAGEYIGEDSVMTIAQIDPLYVEVVVPVECYGKIRLGQNAFASIQFPAKKRLKCRVIVVDKIVDAASATFNVRLKLPNPEALIPAGLKCIVVFK